MQMCRKMFAAVRGVEGDARNGCTLSAALKHAGIVMVTDANDARAHRALHDAEATRRLLLWIAEQKR
jgi:hypothetical protein